MALNVLATTTAPAAMSFAIPTKREYLLWNTASKPNSKLVFIKCRIQVLNYYIHS